MVEDRVGRGPTVLVVGLGDLGARVLDALARAPAVGRLVGTSRDPLAARRHAAQAALVAEIGGGPHRVDGVGVDLGDADATARLFLEVRPDVTVMAASLHTWWRHPDGIDSAVAARLDRLPYGVWLPRQVPLVRRLMEAHRAAGSPGTVVNLAFPDAVGPVLAAAGLAPHLGAGNVDEVAAKLSLLAAREAGVSRERVRVRLVLHHAAERLALGGFLATSDADGETPWAAEVLVDEEPLPAETVTALFLAPYALLAGRSTHPLTAASTARLVTALLGPVPRPLHAPAPGGLPGGYPIVASSAGAELDLPHDLSEAGAVAVNEAGGRGDGIERIAGDGTIVFTSAAVVAIRETLGLELTEVAPADLERVGEELLERARLSAV